MKKVKVISGLLGLLLVLISCQNPNELNNDSNQNSNQNTENKSDDINNDPSSEKYSCSIEIVFPDEVKESMDLKYKAMSVHYDYEKEIMVYDYPEISFNLGDEIWDGFDPHYEVSVENNIAEIPDTSIDTPSYQKTKIVQLSNNKWPSSTVYIEGTKFVCLTFNSKRDGTGTEYKAGDKLTLTEDTVLYGVKWIKENEYSSNEGDSGNSESGEGIGSGVWYKFPDEWSVGTTIVDIYVYYENEQFVKACYVSGTLTRDNPINPWTYERAQRDAVLVPEYELPGFCSDEDDAFLNEIRNIKGALIHINAPGIFFVNKIKNDFLESYFKGVFIAAKGENGDVFLSERWLLNENFNNNVFNEYIIEHRLFNHQKYDVYAIADYSGIYCLFPNDDYYDILIGESFEEVLEIAENNKAHYSTNYDISELTYEIPNWCFLRSVYLKDSFSEKYDIYAEIDDSDMMMRQGYIIIRNFENKEEYSLVPLELNVFFNSQIPTNNYEYMGSIDSLLPGTYLFNVCFYVNETDGFLFGSTDPQRTSVYFKSIEDFIGSYYDLPGNTWAITVK